MDADTSTLPEKEWKRPLKEQAMKENKKRSAMMK
jgi:hypothetical protein